MTSPRKRQRRALFKRQGGLCYYCNQPMALIEEHQKHPSPWTATFEHLDDRWSNERGCHPREYRIVLACLRCNGDRNTARQAAQDLKVLRARGLLSSARSIFIETLNKLLDQIATTAEEEK